MPQYVFHCNKCDSNIKRFTNSNVKQIACSCGSTMERKLPNIGLNKVNETIDTYTNVKRDQNHDELIQQRKDEHYWTVEVPRLIETHSIQTSLENGWLTYNEKGELVINKPPNKR